MQRIACGGALLLLTSTAPAWAQDAATTETAPAVTDETSETPEAQARIKMLILGLEASSGVETDVTRLLDDMATVELSKYPGFDVISDADVQQLVELEANRAAVGCDMSSSCLAEIAGAMGAQYVVSGRIGKLGTRLSLTYNLYDSAKATSVGRVNLSEDSMDKIADGVPGALDELVAGLVKELGLPQKEGSTAAPKVASSETSTTSKTSAASNSGTEVEATEDGTLTEGEADGLSAIWWLVPAGLLAGGAAVFVAGAATDAGLCFAISCNGGYDVLDFVGPGVMASGAVFGAAGLAAVVVLLVL